MEPEAEKLRSALDKKLRKRETAAVHLEAVGEALELLVGLDLGMIDGAVVSKQRKERLTTDLRQLVASSFEGAARLDAPRSGRWLAGLAIYKRPKTIDFTELERLLQASKSTAAAPPALDLAAPEVPVALGKAMRALLDLAAAGGESHRIYPPASAAMIREREREISIPLPDELRLLYRLCNGFSLFRQEGSIDIDGSPFRLVPLHELQPYAFTLGEEVPKRKRNARGKKLEDLIHDPARLQVFDVGNGDFVSCCAAPDATLWIDDYSDGPERVLTDSLAELLDYALSKDRLDPETGQWTEGVWEGLGRRIAAPSRRRT
jgi:hypothetical protein